MSVDRMKQLQRNTVTNADVIDGALVLKRYDGSKVTVEGSTNEMSPVEVYLRCGGAPSGATADVFPELSVPYSRPAASLAFGPISVSANGQITRLEWNPSIDCFSQIELWISNADNTQTLLCYQSGSDIALSAGINKSMAQSDYSENFGTGSDLTIGSNGWVKSTAGGVFWVVAYVTFDIITFP